MWAICLSDLFDFIHCLTYFPGHHHPVNSHTAFIQIQLGARGEEYGFHIEFRQNLAKETFSYDEHLTS